ncbi:MAG: hypothetical protein GX980_01210 [Firmicutes bacterium]|nr:hypothetical protein [Bacillota bacterium]
MIRINLLPPEEREKAKPRVNWLFIGANAVAWATLVLAILGIVQTRNLAIYRQRLAECRRQAASLEKHQQEFMEWRRQEGDLLDEIKQLESLAVGDDTAALMKAIGGCAPRGMGWDKLEYRRRTFYIEGVASDLQGVAQFLGELQGLPGIKELHLEELGASDGPEPIRFGLGISLKGDDGP